MTGIPTDYLIQVILWAIFWSFTGVVLRPYFKERD